MCSQESNSQSWQKNRKQSIRFAFQDIVIFFSTQSSYFQILKETATIHLQNKRLIQLTCSRNLNLLHQATSILLSMSDAIFQPSGLRLPLNSAQTLSRGLAWAQAVLEIVSTVWITACQCLCLYFGVVQCFCTDYWLWGSSMPPPSYLELFQGMDNSSPSPIISVLCLAQSAFTDALLLTFGYCKEWMMGNWDTQQGILELAVRSAPPSICLPLSSYIKNHSLLKKSSRLLFAFYTTQNTQKS